MKRKLTLSMIVVAALAGGCATYPDDDYYDHDRPVVRVAPPPVPYEYPGYAPAVGYVWIGGYWNWIGVRYVWVPGRWEAPRPGYIWVPHRWEHHNDHWRPQGGRWERDHRPATAPAPMPVPAPRIYQERHEVPRAMPAPMPAPAPAPVIRPEPQPQPRFERTPPPAFEQQGRRPAPEGMTPRTESRPVPERVDGPRSGRDERRRPDDDDRRHPRRERDRDEAR